MITSTWILFSILLVVISSMFTGEIGLQLSISILSLSALGTHELQNVLSSPVFFDCGSSFIKLLSFCLLVWFLSARLILEKAMAPHSSTLAWKIPWMEEPGGLLFMGSHRVGHDGSDLAAAAAADWFNVFNVIYYSILCESIFTSFQIYQHKVAHTHLFKKIVFASVFMYLCSFLALLVFSFPLNPFGYWCVYITRLFQELILALQ